uniref:Uncharacterized protein n=1 Tax=Molossus molossus TaxID=27622 RepID=A0A7J8E2N9_MOLMO|nr:hypothetical protein HJG59_008995 [Molossus molossus]
MSTSPTARRWSFRSLQSFRPEIAALDHKGSARVGNQSLLRLRFGDPALLPLPPRALTFTGARAQRRTAERGREGRAGVRACVSLRQRARRRERARGKGGFGRGASASLGYVAQLLGSGYSFLPSPRPSAEFLLRRETVLTPAALPRRQSLLARPWERPGRAALRGEGKPFCPD